VFTDDLILLARYAAPKPLSMFTTATPLAHELSMPSSDVGRRDPVWNGGHHDPRRGAAQPFHLSW
jgi:hypothetical protein